jgi:DnaJ domain
MDPYLVLKLGRNCTRAEVKESFRAKVQTDHPDHGGDETQFIKICTAYRMILSDLDTLEHNAPALPIARDAYPSASRASRSAADPYVKLLRKVASRSDAGKSSRKPSHSDVPDRGSQASKALILAGLVPLVFLVVTFLSTFWESMAGRNDLGANSATPGPIEQVRDAPPPRGEVRSLGRAESVDVGVTLDTAPISDFPNFPQLPVNGQP